MDSERRYSEDEVAAIFRKAAAVDEPSGTRSPLPGTRGMTLAELQDVGREVGISPGAVARAAADLDGPELRTVPRRKMFGLPIGVGRVVDLGRYMSEEEWERLVVDLRDTFDARGKVRADGSFRQWTNGNLSALVEPTDSGHQLRLRTLNGMFRELLFMAPIMFIVAIMLLVANFGEVRGMLFSTVFAAAAGGMFGLSAMRLSRWARLREEQMEEIAARAAARDPALLGEPAAGGSTLPPP